MNQKKFNHKRKFGQNFLLNEKIILQIVNSIDYQKDSQIIEIGPGLGALTKHIVKKCNPIIIEIDSSAIELIKKNISKDITIIHTQFYIGWHTTRIYIYRGRTSSWSCNKFCTCPLAICIAFTDPN